MPPFSDADAVLTWLAERSFLLLHAPRDDALPGLDQGCAEPDALRAELSASGACYVGRFLRGRSGFLSWPAARDAAAAHPLQDMPEADRPAWAALRAGGLPGKAELARWERRLWVVRDAAGRPRPLSEVRPELVEAAARLGVWRGSLRSVARWLLAAAHADDKTLVSYLGLPRPLAKRCLRWLVAAGLAEPAPPGTRKGSRQGRPAALREALADVEFPPEE